MAIASLVLGIISFVLGFIPYVNIIVIIPAIAGLILGIISIANKKKREDGKSRKGLGIAGLILNGVALIVITVSVAIFIVNPINTLQTPIGKYSSSAQSNDSESNDELNEALGDIYDALSESVKDQIDDNRFDDVSGNKWQMDDNSLLVLNNDNTFYWYQDSSVLTDNYYIGTYSVYQGENAIRYIANELDEYGLTEEEQRGSIERGPKYHVYNYYCLVLENEECIMDGKNVLDAPVTTPYWGFYLNENNTEALDFANMRTGNYYPFTKVN